MSITTQIKDEHIDLRLKQNAKQLLERAQKTIDVHEVMSLSAQDSETFVNALSEPVEFNQKLSDALQKHDQSVISK